MRTTIGTLLLFTGWSAVAFATLVEPSVVIADLIDALRILSVATSFTVAFHTTGRIQSYCFTFGVFALLLPMFSACPEWLSTYVADNISFPDLDAGNGGYWLVQGLIDTHFGVLSALFAASLTGSLRAHQETRRKAEPCDEPKTRN
ncbi:hypothetical protein [Stieleria neptunia]|uniref:hypothetical protein n=1 Tax=Stieleria neptunia TaxID=2527979 RepID=UPI0011A6D91D|nr:hypothetical protein [Stieleria neptunia]